MKDIDKILENLTTIHVQGCKYTVLIGSFSLAVLESQGAAQEYVSKLVGSLRNLFNPAVAPCHDAILTQEQMRGAVMAEPQLRDLAANLFLEMCHQLHEAGNHAHTCESLVGDLRRRQHAFRDRVIQMAFSRLAPPSITAELIDLESNSETKPEERGDGKVRYYRAHSTLQCGEMLTGHWHPTRSRAEREAVSWIGLPVGASENWWIEESWRHRGTDASNS